VILTSLSSASTRLRTTFTLYIAGAWLVIGALTVGAFLLSARGLTMVFATRFARTEAMLEKNRVLSRIDREVALALKLADDPVVKQWAVREDDPRLRGLAMGQLESFRRAFTDQLYFIAPLASRHYFIRDTTGSKLQVTTLNPDLPSDQWYFQALKDVDRFALNVDYDRLIQSTKVWINAVMKDDRGVPIGICGTGMDISSFLVQVLQHPDPNDVTILVDRDGTLTAHPNFSYVIRNAEAKSTSGSGTGSASEDAARKVTIYDLLGGPAERGRLSSAISALAGGGHDVESLPLTVEGRRYLAAVAWMPSIDWYNIVLVDTSRVLRVSDFSPLAITILLSLLVLLAAVALLLGRLVIRPLSALAGASHEIASGRYGVQLPVTRADEIGQLTRAFNAMSATVKDTTEGLEIRVQERTRDLTQANRALEESQRLILESLSYARRVQASILPGSEVLAAALAEHAVLYLPRDVVSGDFYVARSFGDHVVAGVIDCMGHGVPGAFMTMRVHAVLSHVLDAVCSDDPARILEELDRSLRDHLLRDDPGQDLDSGLDIALCVWRRGSAQLEFAGAGLSLWIQDGARVTELKGDTRRVGYRKPGSGVPWTRQAARTDAAPAVYLVTDGLLDQAGGPRGFGFGRERLVELLGSMAGVPMAAQMDRVRSALAAWQGSRAQRDDITVLGFRLSGGAT